MAEAIENGNIWHHHGQRGRAEEINLQTPSILDGQVNLIPSGEERLWDAQDREAALGAYTASDLSVVEIEIPTNPNTLLQILWSEYVSANPNLPDGKLVVLGRTMRALAIEHETSERVIPIRQVGKVVFSGTTTAAAK